MTNPTDKPIAEMLDGGLSVRQIARNSALYAPPARFDAENVECSTGRLLNHE